VFGGDRPVQLQVPSDFDESHDYPLVMILHGYGVSGSVQQSFLGLGNLADAEDVLVLAPDGTYDSNNKPFWNAGSAWCETTDCPDDVGYLGGLLDDVIGAWPVDTARVTLVGHSNGHFMSYRMMCDRADVITAIAGLAGLGPIDPCTPSEPVHSLHMHGTADAVVPYAGGDFMGVHQPGAVESVSQTATRNGCTGAPTAGAAKDLDGQLPGAETMVAITSGCPANGAAELWTLEGAGHVPSFNPTFVPELIAWIDAHGRAR
jgi:polyhydroxybutyrate depolymerase